MTHASASRLIAQHLVSRWTSTPIVWENVNPQNLQAAGQPLLPAGVADYVAVRDVGRGSQTITVPAACTQVSRQLFLAACVKAGTGTRKAQAMVDGLIALFENTVLRGNPGEGVVRFRDYTGPATYLAPNGWYVAEVGFMFQFEKVNEALL
jgi:hypothetical protein